MEKGAKSSVEGWTDSKQEVRVICAEWSRYLVVVKIDGLDSAAKQESRFWDLGDD